MAEQTPKNNTREQQAMDGLQRMREYWERNSREEDDIIIRRWKTAGKMVLLLLLCAVLIYGTKLVVMAYVHVRDQNRLNETTAQISQIVENIRQTYTAQGNKLKIEPQYLLQSGIIPPSMLASDGSLRHVFGGKLVILPSRPAENSLPTFKLSYQGLPHKICVALAQMDWGTAEQGLQAVALGVANDEGYDKALEDIDQSVVKPQPKRIQGADGKWRLVMPRPKYLLNVARPNDQFRPTPFEENDAVAGCACGHKNYCSFALRYAF